MVIGAAFNAVVQSLVKNIVMPIVGIVGGKPTFDDYFFTVNKSAIRWGSFVTDLVNFVIITAAVFVAVKAFEKLQERRKGGDEAVTDEPLTVEGELLTEIRDLLRGQRPSSAPTSPGTPRSANG
ncbi:MAG: large conductance mechanosensitive channel protein MscL [Actinomycetota bacterium]|nr:large conductance mechanosensitive channel protein MscL [Actinomycetota bacterium]